MRKGEKAKIRMKKKFAFGRPGEVDKLRFPKGFSKSEEDAERREKLLTKSLIYEVHLVDWVERSDVDADGKIFKQLITKARRNEHEHATDNLDRVHFDLRIYQKSLNPDTAMNEIELIKMKEYSCSMD